MVYFLKPTYSMDQPSSPSLDISSGNNLYMMIAIPLVVVVVFSAFLYMKRPTMLGLYKKDDSDKDGKPKMNTMKVLLAVLLVGALSAGATYGGLMLSHHKSS